MAIDFKTELSGNVSLPDTDGVSLFVDATTKKIVFKDVNGSVKFFAEAQIGKRKTVASPTINMSDGTIQVLHLTSSAPLSVTNAALNKQVLLEVSSSNLALLNTYGANFVNIGGEYNRTGAKNYIYIRCIDETTPLFLVKVVKRSS